MRLALIALLLCPALAAAYDYRNLFAIAIALEAGPTPGPAPGPAPVGDKCENCNGTGKLGDGTVFVTCPVCGGTGKNKKAGAAVLGYSDAWREAQEDGKALAVFVGCPALDVPGAVSVEVAGFNGSSKARVVLIRNRNGLMFGTVCPVLPPDATEADIRMEMTPPAAAPYGGVFRALPRGRSMSGSC